MSTMYNLLHIPLCTVMLILQLTVMHILLHFIFILYILFFIHLILCLLPLCCFFYICTVHGADPTLISLLVIQSLYSRVCDK